MVGMGLGKFESQQSYKRAELTHPNSFDSRHFNFNERLKAASSLKVYGRWYLMFIGYELITKFLPTNRVINHRSLYLLALIMIRRGKIPTSPRETLGTVEATNEIIESLVKNSPVKINDGIFITEHSWFLMPFIKFFQRPR